MLRVLAAHTAFYIWDGLGTADQAYVLRPFADADFLATHPH